MPKPALTRQLPMLGTRSRMTSQSSFCAEKAPAFEGRKPGALEGGKLHPPHCPSRKTTMSAITSTPAYLSAKARVAPGVSGARAAVARPAGTRRAFVVRASAEQKKGACAEVFHLVCGERHDPTARARVHVRQARRRTRRSCERRGVPAIASSFRASSPPSSTAPSSSFSPPHDELTTRHVFQIPLPTGPQPLRAVAEPPGATRSSPFTDVGVEELDPEVRSSDDPSPARLRPSPPPRRFEKPPPPPRRWQPPPVALQFLPTRP